MLESETKRRIDTARDILVGKVPDPKSQVEQITIALIYKFMDDMDRESVEMGGKASFFTGEYKRYRWSNIFDPRLGGQEMLNLYAEAIVKLNQNAGIPQLFRDIFKNAYLPYRDPETLKLFLRTINDFVYDHSENLGDAFEYLLSVLGSQGDAGQFRTPRNIIDFMVEVIDPKKNEIIIDPACGTAGFLISSFRHIIKANTKKAPGDLLTTRERKNLLDNFHGYDISPDMVRLSLVNLYLHGFSQPKIFEYDTLTSDERWNEYADVILANPPFMSPKGGIKPHKRFSVQSSRSEVLFVDYIAEHLNTQGRAAIIVPEGIIFQSGNAYKQLRKILVTQYLYAVASLPAGVFNPYSGVKTSILFLDPLLARKSDSILFVKIENDGFSLGAQRRAIEKNDLPEAAKVIGEFRKKIVNEEFLPRTTQTNMNDKKEGGAKNILRRRGGAEETGKKKGRQGTGNNEQLAIKSAVGNLIVSREKIAEGGEYNLVGDRYRTEEKRGKQKWPMVKLGDKEFFSVESGGTPDSKNNTFWNGNIYWATLIDLPQNDYITIINDTQRKITQEGLKNSSAKIIPSDSIIVSTRATIGRIGINKIPICTNQGFKNVIIKDKNKVNYIFLAYIIKLLVPKMQLLASGGTFKEISKTSFCSLEIPLPPIELQQEIITEIKGYQKIIDGARQVIENWKPHIEVDPDWPMVKLGTIVTKITDGTHSTPTYTDHGVPFLRVTDITESNVTKKFISKDEHKEFIKRCHPEKGDILYSKNGTIGIAKLIDWNWEFSIFVSLCLIKPKKDTVDSCYLTFLLNSDYAYSQAVARSKSGTVTNLHLIDIKTINIPLPPLKIQRAIVEEIEAEQTIVEANRVLINKMEKKIQALLTGVWR